MTITYRDEKGSPLTKEELDENFRDLDGRTQTLEGLTDTDGALRGIVSMTPVSDYAVEVLYTDDTTDTFFLPTAAWSYAGEWMPDHEYHKNEIISYRPLGTFLITADHTTGDEFEIELLASTDGDPVYIQIGPARDTFYDLGVFISGGVPEGNTAGPALLFGHSFSREVLLEENLGGIGQGYLGTASVAETLVLTLEKNGVEIGTITFEPASNTGTISFPAEVEFGPGQRLTILGPETVDVAASDLMITIPASRND